MDKRGLRFGFKGDLEWMNLANDRESRMMESECLAFAVPTNGAGSFISGGAQTSRRRIRHDAFTMCIAITIFPFSLILIPGGSLTLFLTLCGAAIFGYRDFTCRPFRPSLPDSLFTLASHHPRYRTPIVNLPIRVCLQKSRSLRLQDWRGGFDRAYRSYSLLVDANLPRREAARQNVEGVTCSERLPRTAWETLRYYLPRST